MKNKFNFSSKQILTACTVICLFIIGTSFFTDIITKPVRKVVSYVVVPMQKGINSIGLYVYDRIETLQEISRVLEENEELRAQVAELTEENIRLQSDKYELERYRTLYEIYEEYEEYTKVGANVIAKESGNWFSVFTIDKGSNDGIEVDMNVIASGGLVGIVTEVGDDYAIVKSIIDDSNNVSAMLIQTGDTCAVEGDLSLMDTGMILLKYFKKDVVVSDGDRIVTSNISDKYLEGILIGYAKDVTLDSNSLTQSGYLVPAVDFEHLQEVLVILEKK